MKKCVLVGFKPTTLNVIDQIDFSLSESTKGIPGEIRDQWVSGEILKETRSEYLQETRKRSKKKSREDSMNGKKPS